MKGKIKLFFGQEFFNNRIILWLSAFNFFSNLAGWVALKVYLPPSGRDIILHYNVYFGVDVTGDSRGAYVLPLIGLVVLALNFLLSFYFYRRKERVASYVLLLAALMVQLGLLISATSVIIINY